MTNRQQRRMQQKAERKAQKLEQRRQNQIADQRTSVPPQCASTDDEPCATAHQTTISDRKLAANRANAQLSTGPTSTAGKSIVAQNRIRHGLTGSFRVLGDESQQEFDYLVETLIDEHAPADSTEAEFIQQMAEALWLSRRSVRLQDACILALEFGNKEEQQAARKDFALFMRYQATHERAFSRYSTELRKRRNERRRVERGFESQKRRAVQESRRQELGVYRQATEIRKQERHDMAMRAARAKCERLEKRKTVVEPSTKPVFDADQSYLTAA